MIRIPSLFKQCICEVLLRIFYNEIRLITKRFFNPNNVFITKTWHNILLFEYFKEKSWLTSLTTLKVGLLIFQLSITEVSSALDHSNMWMHKLKKLKTKSCVRLIHSLLFIFSLIIDSLIKQQTAWFRDSSKYQKPFSFFFFIWNWRIIVSFWYYIHIKTQVNRNFRTSTFLLFPLMLLMMSIKTFL
jgi:hypothetical protein